MFWAVPRWDLLWIRGSKVLRTRLSRSLRAVLRQVQWVASYHHFIYVYLINSIEFQCCHSARDVILPFRWVHRWPCDQGDECLVASRVLPMRALRQNAGRHWVPEECGTVRLSVLIFLWSWKSSYTFWGANDCCVSGLFVGNATNWRRRLDKANTSATSQIFLSNCPSSIDVSRLQHLEVSTNNCSF